MFLWAFFVCTWYEHVVEHLQRHLKHNTAPSTLHKAANQVRADRSVTNQADRVGESQHIVERLYSSRVHQTNEKIDLCPACKKGNTHEAS